VPPQKPGLQKPEKESPNMEGDENALAQKPSNFGDAAQWRKENILIVAVPPEH
jgi:hypothetical protein